MPAAVYDEGVPVLCRTERTDVLTLIQGGQAYESVVPFGSAMCRMETLRELKRLGQRVNYVFAHCFALPRGVPITAPADIDEQRLEPLWRKVESLPKQYSNLFNAMTLGTKMHSLGHSEEDGEGFYALSMEEVDLITEVEHNRWSVEELLLGYRPLTDEEVEQVEADVALKKEFRKKRKAHYDLRAFDDLREDGTGKNVQVYDMALTQGIPLIMKG